MRGGLRVAWVRGLEGCGKGGHFPAAVTEPGAVILIRQLWTHVALSLAIDIEISTPRWHLAIHAYCV